MHVTTLRQKSLKYDVLEKLQRILLKTNFFTYFPADKLFRRNFQAKVTNYKIFCQTRHDKRKGLVMLL